MTAGVFPDELHAWRDRPGRRSLHLAACWCWQQPRPRPRLLDALRGWLRGRP